MIRLIVKQGNNVVHPGHYANWFAGVGAQRSLKKGITDFSWCVLWQYQPIMFFAGLKLFLISLHVIMVKEPAINVAS